MTANRKDIIIFFELSVALSFFLALSGCLHMESSHRGVVKDAETGKPLKGVVVHIDIESGAPVGPEGVTRWKDSYETLTDEEGEFSLPIKLIGQGPLEISNWNQIEFIKAGYFKSTIAEPTSYSSVSLYPIKYFLDYIYYKESLRKGDLKSHFMDYKPKAFVEYRKELNKIASMRFVGVSDKGVFLEVQGAKLSELHCTSSWQPHSKYSEAYTFGVVDNVCMVVDDVSGRRLTFNTQGKIDEFKDNLLSNYKYFSSGPDEGWTVGKRAYVYASEDSIYIPCNMYSKKEENITPQKGHITAMTGNGFGYLTIEEGGKSLCFYTTIAVGDVARGCISAKEISQNDKKEGKCLEKFVRLTIDALRGKDYFVISKTCDSYQLHKIYREPRSGEKRDFGGSELLLTFPVDDEIIDFDSDDRSVFIVFEKSGIKKYSLDIYGKGPMKEEKAFYNNTYGLFTGKVSAVRIGRSASGRAVYVTVGSSMLYRMSMDGILDQQIKISEK